MNDYQFKAYQTMGSDERRLLVDNEIDVLTEAVQKDQDFLNTISCVKCGTAPCLAKIDAKRPFGGGLLPRRIMQCQNCGLEFEPYTGIQINMGGVPKSDIKMSEMFIGGYKNMKSDG